MANVRCVVLILLGPGDGDIYGAQHLCASLFHYEPDLIHVVLVCDNADVAAKAEAITTRFDRRISAIVPRPKHPVDKIGKYLGANVLYGLQSVTNRFHGDFVLKLDADSMVISQFSEQIGAFLSSHAKNGICGTLGRTSAREHKTYGYEATLTSPLLQMVRKLPSEQWQYILSLSDEALQLYAVGDLALAADLRACSTIAEPVQEAVKRGYHWLEYCQGGGYAMSWSLLTAMHGAGYLAHAPALYSLPTGEDVLMSMYCRALGFRVLDYSDCGQPFACAWRGLPYPVEVLFQRQHAIVHSLKGDPNASREELQSIFQKSRLLDRARGLSSVRTANIK
jgi:hypothetical protein